MSSADDPQSNGAFFTSCLMLLLGLIALGIVVATLALWVMASLRSANVELIQW